MKISKVGEFRLIERLAQMVNSARDTQAASWQQLLIGIGDDAAAWQGSPGIQLATVDSLIENVHFTLGTTSWEDLGWKALAINLSDIAAMGGMPRYALVSLTLPDDTEVDDVTALYHGMIELAKQSGVAIVGGDTNRDSLVSVTVTVLGNIERQGRVLTRSSAAPGDKVAVTGYLGAAAAGLNMLMNQLEFDTEVTNSLRRAFLRPHARVAEGQLLASEGVKTAIDISDGLISDLSHICQQSRVGARIEMERVPVHPAVKANFSDKSLELALAGGEDYELLFTADAQTISRIKEKASCPITVIGEITRGNIGEVTLVDSQGKPASIVKRGWEHFSAK